MSLSESLFDIGPPPPCPPRFNLAAHALWNGQAGEAVALSLYGDACALRERWRYDDLRDAVGRVAGGFRALGLKPGDRIMLRLGHSSRFPLLFLGAVAAGCIAVPTSAMLTQREASFIAEDLDAALICVDDALSFQTGRRTLDGAAMDALLKGDPTSPVDTARDDPAFIVYTSGSSGRPKGVAHAHRSAWARRMMWRGWYGLTADDVLLHAGAFNWTYTLGAGLLDPWGAGATAAIYDGPQDPTIWPRLAAASGATIFAATPGVYRRILTYGGDIGDGFAGLRHGLTAGEKMPETLIDRWREQTGKPLYEALGMSEISTYISGSPGALPRSGRIGRPQEGRRVAILAPGAVEPAPIGETGELAVSRSDPGLMLGYWNAPNETRAAQRGEWFVTGDIAEMDADGYIAYRGRADDLINAGGYRVAPQEVEDALLSHPGVQEAAAAAAAVREDVSVLAAFVVAPGVDAAALDAWCAERLAAYKRPRTVKFVDALPRTPTGKLRRRDLPPL